MSETDNSISHKNALTIKRLMKTQSMIRALKSTPDKEGKE